MINNPSFRNEEEVVDIQTRRQPELLLSRDLDVTDEMPTIEIAIPKLTRMEQECALVSALVDAGLLRSDIYFEALNLLASGNYTNTEDTGLV